MLTSTSLWDVRGEPAMGSILDFGPIAEDWTPGGASTGIFFILVVPYLKHRQSDKDEHCPHASHHHNSPAKKQQTKHPSAFDLVL